LLHTFLNDVSDRSFDGLIQTKRDSKIRSTLLSEEFHYKPPFYQYIQPLLGVAAIGDKHTGELRKRSDLGIAQGDERFLLAARQAWYLDDGIDLTKGFLNVF